jgi:hypothetical protein
MSGLLISSLLGTHALKLPFSPRQQHTHAHERPTNIPTSADETHQEPVADKADGRVAVARASAPDMSADMSANEENLSELLDRLIIDPWSDSTHEHAWLAWFKALVREDYTSAETIWVGVYCSLGVSVGMSLVRGYIWAQDAFPVVEACAVVYCTSSASPW